MRCCQLLCLECAKGDTKAYDAHVSVDRGDAFIGVGFEEFAGDELLYCEDDPVFASDAYGCAACFNCFDCVFHLRGVSSDGNGGGAT